MIRLDYRDARPIYEQVKDGLRRLMVTGVCPEVFSILPGESAQAITEPVPQEYLAAQEAADSCPVGAIELK